MTDPVREPVPRHAFLRVATASLANAWPDAPDQNTVDFALTWFARGWPAIRTRSEATMLPESIAAGIATPPSQGKQRIALNLPLGAVTRWMSPPLLSSIAATCPLRRHAIFELALGMETIGLQMRVFGSFAWQYLTGLAYVTPSSDLDLLWHPCSIRELVAGVELLAQWELDFGMCADGEAVFPNGDAVSWREWATPRDTVLVKGMNGARLAARATYLAMLSSPQEAH